MPQNPRRGIDAVLRGDQRAEFLAKFVERLSGGNAMLAKPMIDYII